MNITVICPTYNAGNTWFKWIEGVQRQEHEEFNVIIIDSSSTDNTLEVSKKAGFDVLVISKNEFNHSATRNKAAKYAKEKYDSDFLIFLTQDAILSTKDSIHEILRPFSEASVAAVCGRQVPHSWADPIARHSRIFNYPNTSRQSSISDVQVLGLKTAYMSNSFAAYKYSIFAECGGFPDGLIFGEDMFLTAKMILAGNKVEYSAKAVVNHSHNYSLKEEFERYFDIGVFHKSQPLLLNEFGKPNSEGMRFAISEMKYCFKHGGFLWAINSTIRTCLKFIGYHLGKRYQFLPKYINMALSMDKNYWNQ